MKALSANMPTILCFMLLFLHSPDEHRFLMSDSSANTNRVISIERSQIIADVPHLYVAANVADNCRDNYSTAFTTGWSIPRGIPLFADDKLVNFMFNMHRAHFCCTHCAVVKNVLLLKLSARHFFPFIHLSDCVVQHASLFDRIQCNPSVNV